MIANILTIAGSDPSGGAGIQADLKTIGALGGYGMSAITALTAQNTCGVQGVHSVPPDFVNAQIEAVFDDIRVDAVKTGMIGDVQTIDVIVAAIERYAPAHIVVDPVMVAGSGDPLIDKATLKAMKERLIPRAHVITPNIPEAEMLLGQSFDGDMEGCAAALLALGTPAVLLKGGHASSEHSTDIYCDQGGTQIRLSALRVETKNTHGTGCTLASALATKLGQGYKSADAARGAKDYVTGAIKHADQLEVGQGSGPTHHFWAHKHG